MVTFHVLREQQHHVLAEVLLAQKRQTEVTTSLHAVLIRIVPPHLHHAVLLWVAVASVVDLEVQTLVEAASVEVDAEVAVVASAEVVDS